MIEEFEISYIITLVRRFFGVEKWNGWSSDGGWPNRVDGGKWFTYELLKSIWEKYGWWWWWCTVGGKNDGSVGGGGIRLDSIAAVKSSFWRFSTNLPIDTGDVILLARAKSCI